MEDLMAMLKRIGIDEASIAKIEEEEYASVSLIRTLDEAAFQRMANAVELTNADRQKLHAEIFGPRSSGAINPRRGVPQLVLPLLEEPALPSTWSDWTATQEYLKAKLLRVQTSKLVDHLKLIRRALGSEQSQDALVQLFLQAKNFNIDLCLYLYIYHV